MGWGEDQQYYANHDKNLENMRLPFLPNCSAAIEVVQNSHRTVLRVVKEMVSYSNHIIVTEVTAREEGGKGGVYSLAGPEVEFEV